MTQRENMKARDRREGMVELVYIQPDGTRTIGHFSLDQVERCEVCNRNVPTEHMKVHLGFQHGRK